MTDADALAAPLEAHAPESRPRRHPRLRPSLALRDTGPVGRPPDTRRALLDALQRLSTPTIAPTLLELAVAAQVGRSAAKATIAKLVSTGRVRIVRRRWVAYRRSPVAEYALADPTAVDDPRAHLVHCMSGFAR